MSVESWLHAGEIDCLISRLVNGVRWLGVFARVDLPYVTREKRPWCLILNTDPKDLPGTHWLARYAPQSGRIELFDSFGFSPSMFCLDSLVLLHLLYSHQSPSYSLYVHYCMVYTYRRSRHTSQHQIFHLLLNISNRDLWVTKYIYNLKTLFCILNPCNHTG